MSVSLKMKGTEQFARLKGHLRKEVLHDRIGVRMMRWIAQNFREEGSERKWPKLRSSTIFGRRKFSSKPLHNTGRLQQDASYRATQGHVVVGWPTESVARYHHFGTSGPYEIRPRTAKALRFFAAPMSMLGTGQVRTSLQRRGKGTPQVGVVSAKFAKAAGLKIPKGRGNLQSVAFAKFVRHPGLPVRQLLPSVPLAKTLAKEVIENILKEAVLRGAN